MCVGESFGTYCINKINGLKTKPDFIRGLGDSSRVTADLAVEAVGDSDELLKELIELSFTQPYPVSMRSARVVQLCCEYRPERILPHIDGILHRLTDNRIDGVKRSYLKVINDYLGPEKIEDPGHLVQLCFDWLVSDSESVAVRYHSLGILLKICNGIPDLKPELLSVLEMISEAGTSSKGLNKLLHVSEKQLRQQNQTRK